MILLSELKKKLFCFCTSWLENLNRIIFSLVGKLIVALFGFSLSFFLKECLVDLIPYYKSIHFFECKKNGQFFLCCSWRKLGGDRRKFLYVCRLRFCHQVNLGFLTQHTCPLMNAHGYSYLDATLMWFSLMVEATTLMCLDIRDLRMIF